MPLVVAALLGICAAILVLYPLLGPRSQGARADASAYADVAARERSAKDALRELDFDYRLGALEDADYQSLRERYEERALAALQTRFSRELELDAVIDRELAALREREPRTPHAAQEIAETSAPGSVSGRLAPPTTKRTGGAARRRRGGARG